MDSAYQRFVHRLVYVSGPRLASRIRQRWAIAKNPHATVRFGPDCRLHRGFSLHMPHGGEFIAGRGVEFRTGFRAEIGGGRVAIGDHCMFSYYTLIQCSTSIEIGDRCRFGQSTILIDGNHNHTDPALPAIGEEGYAFRPLVIGDEATVLSKATIINDIGVRAVVAANAVVTKPVPAYTLAGGVPAREIEYFGPPR